MARAFTFVATLGAILLLASCQVRPLYDTAGLTQSQLGKIAFSEATGRVEQLVRNQLIFMTSGGAGEAEQADYNVTLSASSSVTNVLLIDSSDTARAGQVTVRATYQLVRNSDQQVLKSGTRSSTALVDFSIQEFSKIRAIRDAENRAAREAAELVRADLAVALSH